MEATPVVLLLTLSSDNSPHQPCLFHITMLSSFTFFISLTFFILIFTLRAVLKNNNNRSNGGEKEQNPIKIEYFTLNDDGRIAQQQKQEKGCEPAPENLARSLILPSSSPKRDTLFTKSEEFDDDPGEKNGLGQEEKKRRKKRHRKKRPGPTGDERSEVEELVGQFVNCLVEERNELQNKSEVIKRKFIITKALLFRADRSSFDRLLQQLELEQKRLEEDAFVYDFLQEQLRVSPAYKKILEIGACTEMKEKSSSHVESKDADVFDISFEELLAQAKKLEA